MTGLGYKTRAGDDGVLFGHQADAPENERMMLPMKRLFTLCVAASLALSPMSAVADVLDDVAFETVTSGVSGVVAIRHAGDGSGRLFLVLQGGTLRIVDAGGALLPAPFLNIGSGGTTPPLGFTGSGERGLLGLAFHPQYLANRQFYVYYTDGNGDTVVAEYKTSIANPNLADTSTARVIIRVYQPFSNHNGGDIHFGPDGYLYIALGDGGSGNDPCNSGQSLTTATMSGCAANAAFLGAPPAGVPVGNAGSRALLGKMLRIDVDSTNTPTGADLCGADPALRTYGIPDDNPFAGNAGSNADACDETYHYGLRNPWRFGFDRLTDDLIIGDVGQDTWEELNLVSGAAAGLNFGWKTCEGFHQRESTTTLCSLPGHTAPIVTYRIGNGVGQGRSIAGGYRYRGPYTSLRGILFSGDYTGKIFAIRQSTDCTWSIDRRYTGVGNIVGFGEGEDGHLYAANIGGTVLRVVGPGDPVFEDGFEPRCPE